MKNKEIVKELVKLQFLCIRWIERNNKLECKTQRDMERVLTGKKLTCTYLEAVRNLESYIMVYCNDSIFLMESILKLEGIIKESDIKDLRFGYEPQKKFTEEEKELANYKLERSFFMLNEMVAIKYASEKLGITESAIKQACQQQRLLNTYKVGKTWVVHLPECKDYWNIEKDL